MLENGIGERQAADESGAHQATLSGGLFVDRWRTTRGTTGSCRGTYEADGNRVTFK